MAYNRKAARKKWETLMAAALDIDAIYSYQRKKLDGLSSVLVVTSDGSNRETDGAEISPVGLAYYAFHMFVRYEDGASWTEENSEDFLDDFESGVAEVIQESQERRDESNPEWTRARIQSESRPDVFVDLDGLEYRHEVIRVECELYNDA